MKYRERGIIDHCFTRFPDPNTIVDILRRIEYPLIEKADTIEKFTAEKPAGRYRTVNFRHTVKREPSVRIPLVERFPEKNAGYPR